MNIRASGAPDFTQNFNRYSYCLNNPLVYIDQDGEIIGWIIGGLLIGAYVGASIKGGSFNPAKWQGNWWQGAIWGGAIGALTGGIAGSIWAAGGTINFGISIFGKEIPALVFTKAATETGGLVTLGIGGTTAATSIVSYTLGHRQEPPQKKIKRTYSEKTKDLNGHSFLSYSTAVGSAYAGYHYTDVNFFRTGYFRTSKGTIRSLTDLKVQSNGKYLRGV